MWLEFGAVSSVPAIPEGGKSHFSSQPRPYLRLHVFPPSAEYDLPPKKTETDFPLAFFFEKGRSALKSQQLTRSLLPFPPPLARPTTNGVLWVSHPLSNAEGEERETENLQRLTRIRAFVSLPVLTQNAPSRSVPNLIGRDLFFPTPWCVAAAPSTTRQRFQNTGSALGYIRGGGRGAKVH